MKFEKKIATSIIAKLVVLAKKSPWCFGEYAYDATSGRLF